jgi:hypothetical protein
MRIHFVPSVCLLFLASLVWAPASLVLAQVIDPSLQQTPEVDLVLPLSDGGMVVITDASYINGQQAYGNISVRKLRDDGTEDIYWSRPQFSHTAAQDPVDGSLLVAGGFSQVNGPNGAEPRNRFARFSVSGELSAWDVQPESGAGTLRSVRRMWFLGSGDLIFVADGDASLLQRLCLIPAGSNLYRCLQEVSGEVRALLVLADGSVLLGGNISGFNGEPASPLLRLLPESLARDEAFNYTDTSTPINAIEVQNGEVWIAAGTRLRRLLADGSVDEAASIDADGPIRSLRADGADGLFVGGSFSTLGGENRARIARVHTSSATGIDLLWQAPAIEGEVRDISVLPDRVLAAGRLQSVPAQAAGLIALERADGVVVQTQRPARLGQYMYSTPLISTPTPDGGAVFAGNFTQSRDAVHPGLIKVDQHGTVIPGWAPVLPGRVVSMVAGPDGFLYVGLVRDISSLYREYSLRRLALGDGALDPQWQWYLSNQIPSALTIDSGSLWFGVRSDTSGGVSSSLRRISLGATALPEGPWGLSGGFTGVVGKIIHLPDGSVLVLRAPVSSGGVVFFPPPSSAPPGPRIYRFVAGPSGVAVQPFGPDLSGFLSDMLRKSDGRILALEMGGSQSRSLHRLSPGGELEASIMLAPTAAPAATGSIALDEDRDLLYYGAVVPDPDWIGDSLQRQVRLQLATQSVDDSWPNADEDPGVWSKLILQGPRLFAAAYHATTYEPIGAFMHTSVPPLFEDGFEAN